MYSQVSSQAPPPLYLPCAVCGGRICTLHIELTSLLHDGPGPIIAPLSLPALCTTVCAGRRICTIHTEGTVQLTYLLQDGPGPTIAPPPTLYLLSASVIKQVSTSLPMPDGALERCLILCYKCRHLHLLSHRLYIL
jgi:hypothetical protein